MTELLAACIQMAMSLGFDIIFAALGIIGLPSIADWSGLIQQATLRSKFIGADAVSFPRDFAVYARYHDDLLRTITERRALPPPLTLWQFDQFLRTHAHRYQVGWIRDLQPLAA